MKIIHTELWRNEIKNIKKIYECTQMKIRKLIKLFIYLDVLTLCGLHFFCVLFLFFLPICSGLIIIFGVCAFEITPFCGFITIIVIASLSLSLSFTRWWQLHLIVFEETLRKKIHLVCLHGLLSFHSVHFKTFHHHRHHNLLPVSAQFTFA